MLIIRNPFSVLCEEWNRRHANQVRHTDQSTITEILAVTNEMRVSQHNQVDRFSHQLVRNFCMEYL